MPSRRDPQEVHICFPLGCRRRRTPPSGSIAESTPAYFALLATAPRNHVLSPVVELAMKPQGERASDAQSLRPSDAWALDEAVAPRRALAEELCEREGLHRAPAAEPWADRACHVRDERSDAAARARELLARQVRDGEISVVGDKAGPGDAAALAATLAALLGVRRQCWASRPKDADGSGGAPVAGGSGRSAGGHSQVPRRRPSRSRSSDRRRNVITWPS